MHRKSSFFRTWLAPTWLAAFYPLPPWVGDRAGGAPRSRVRSINARSAGMSCVQFVFGARPPAAWCRVTQRTRASREDRAISGIRPAYLLGRSLLGGRLLGGVLLAKPERRDGLRGAHGAGGFGSNDHAGAGEGGHCEHFRGDVRRRVRSDPNIPDRRECTR
jgi:hypothetical protein